MKRALEKEPFLFAFKTFIKVITQTDLPQYFHPLQLLMKHW